MDKLLKYIDEHIEEKITIADMANVLGYSEYHFIRIFKSNMNLRPMEYVCKRKLIKASKDIIAGAKILDVALKYGWDTHSGFTKAFYREFRISPSLLRAIVVVKELGGCTMKWKKEELYAVLLEKIKANGLIETGEILNYTYNIRDDIRKDIMEDRKIDDYINIEEIYNCVCNAYKGVKRYSGEEYITHTLNVAIILADMGADIDTVLAGLFCDVVRKGVVSLESLEHLPKSIYELIVQVQDDTKDFSNLPENILLIKLAQRLHNMRTVEYMDDVRIGEKAEETIELLKPLADRIDNKEILDELNVLGVKYL